MSAVNIINDNNMQYNSYVASRDVKPVSVEITEGSRVAQESNTSVNEYGDEFVRSSIIKTEDGAVYSKPVNGEDRSARVPAEEELPKIDSLIGYTTAQVQRFYYEGRISRYDYDVEMEQKSELLKSNSGTNDSEDARGIVSTTGDVKTVDAPEATASEVAKAETAKTADKKADESERQVKADNERVYDNSRSARDEIVEDAKKNAEVLNAEMSVIENEQREDEEFEIIESGNDPVATFKLVQNLSNLGLGVEGGTWNIA
ncbi:MAG: hypothetical protein K5644_09375 [Lachnospiraceae bacterium]|nr:hypothetical protein [Lachnospiraceae bacterium]